MQTVIELALKAPFKLRVVQIAGMKLKIVSMYGNVRILEFDDDFHRLTLSTCIEIEQGMLVKT